MLAARGGAGAGVREGQHAVRRDEHVMGSDVLAAGAGEPVDEPVVDDLDIADRQQEEGALVGRRGTLGRDEAAELDPARMVAAAGEGPASGEAIAALDRHRRSGRRKAGAGERFARQSAQTSR